MRLLIQTDGDDVSGEIEGTMTDIVAGIATAMDEDDDIRKIIKAAVTIYDYAELKERSADT